MNPRRVCSACFGNQDLRGWIREYGGRRGCDFCGKFDSPTVEFDKLVPHIDKCIGHYYGRAVDQLGYCSAEGGYLGEHWDAYDMLEQIDIDLPRDDGTLFYAIAGAMEEEPWCDYDVGALELDHAMWSSWEDFCETVKHKRRFFFHHSGRDGQDSFTPASLLSSIAKASEALGLVIELPVGQKLWRARTDIGKRRRVGAKDFGPPPVEFALQSNRMNPAGIPMLYLASSQTTALKETRTREAKVGRWRSVRPLRILDLRRLPPVPSIFSEKPRALALTLNFLHDFANDIMKPVERSNQVHVDYLPSQVITEFMRDYDFTGGPLDGVAYGSTVHRIGWNLALFVGPVELGLAAPEWEEAPPQAFEFDCAIWATA